MQTKQFTRTILFVALIILLINVVPVFAQNEDTRNPVYICILGNESPQLLEVRATEPIALIFTSNVNVIVYSSPNVPMVADVIHVEPDTATGTYRHTGNVVTGAQTTSNILPQGNCQEQFGETLAELERTILLPLSSDQVLAVRPVGSILPYDNAESSLFIGAIGILFRDDDVNFPHFQILRFNGGNNDTISIAFPTFTEDVRWYMVSRQVVELTFSAGDVVSQPKFMENLPFFLSLLAVGEVDLIDDILIPGDFRLYVEYGEEIIYRNGTLQNFSRLSSFEPRLIVDNSTMITPIYCGPNIRYFRSNNYNQHIYLQGSSDTVGVIRCGEEKVVEAVLLNGILVVEGGFYIASWLVDIVE